ncbi:hypothetical protein JW865_04635 [Candidatus Bathyarchaeota archaeon]|nr:hypothetical protein [Candidatus Bathyarchaeota archaeon]
MDLKQEYEKIEEHIKVEWFKAKIGKYQIVIIGEPEEDVYVSDDEKQIEQVVFTIEILKKRYKWSVSKGLTFASLYGQIIALSKQNNYKTNGLSFTLLVKNDGYKNDYTILEAMDLINKIV